MKITLTEVKQALNDLVQKQKTREQIADWAHTAQIAEDSGNLEYEPSNEEKRIWRSITYLMGVDLKDFDGDYLHSTEDFIEFKNKMNL